MHVVPKTLKPLEKCVRNISPLCMLTYTIVHIIIHQGACWPCCFYWFSSICDWISLRVTLEKNPSGKLSWLKQKKNVVFWKFSFYSKFPMSKTLQNKKNLRFSPHSVCMYMYRIYLHTDIPMTLSDKSQHDITWMNKIHNMLNFT